MGELPRRKDGHRSLLNAALLVNVLVGSILGLGFALIAPLVSSNLGALGESLPRPPSSRWASASPRLRSFSIRR